MRGFITLLFSLALFFVPSAYAQQASISADLTPTPTVTIEYTLPYPGILPDNPLYFFKAVRDNVVGFLIVEPVKKAEFDLLQADKRLQAGSMLLAENPPKTALAITTISKGENYFFDAIGKVKQAKAQGVVTNDFLLKLETAARKHDQILMDMKATVHGSDRQGVTLLINRVQGFEKSLSSLTKKQK